MKGVSAARGIHYFFIFILTVILYRLVTMSEAPAKHWCATWNNPKDKYKTDLALVAATLHRRCDQIAYAVYQLEKGLRGTEHFQMYFEFGNKMRLSALKKILKTAHWEKRRGTREQARAYCMKDDSRVEGTNPMLMYGDCSVEEVSQDDQDEVIQVIDLVDE